MKILLISLLMVLGSYSFAASNGLSISATPQNPVLIPYGTTTINGEAITGPYFVISSLNLVSHGRDVSKIIAVTVRSYNSVDKVECTKTGRALQNIFPELVNSQGLVVVPAGSVTLASGPIGCTAEIPSNTTIPQTFNIPMKVQVVADHYYEHHYLGRTWSTTYVTAQ